MPGIDVRRTNRTDFSLFFQCIQRVYGFRNRRKTGFDRLPVGHIDINTVDTQSLQAGINLFANRLRREVFIQLAIAHFVKQAACSLPDDAAFGFNHYLAARQLFQRLTDYHFTVAKVVSWRGINQINTAAMRLNNGINTNLQIEIAIPCRTAANGPCT